MILLLLISGILQASSGHAHDLESLWREAVGLYTDESNDYIDSLSQTQDDLKYWRQKVLQSRFDEKITQLESILSKSNSEVLSQISLYVKSNGIESLDDSLMMRMAQLHYDRAGFDMSTKMRQYEIQLVQFQSGKIDKAPDLPAPNYSKAIYFSAMILKRFPGSPLSDRAHYLLGYCLFDEGRSEKAAQIYERMIIVHPYSELANEVRWRLAEYYFDNGNFERALSHYEYLAKNENMFTTKAHYKMGSTYYSTDKYSEAAAIFKKLLSLTGENSHSADPGTETLHDEAVDYLAYLKAKGVNLDLDENDDALVTERLAHIYRRLQDEDGNRKTYLSFVVKSPLARVSPRFMNEVIESYANDDARTKAQEVRNRFVQGLGPQSPYWTKYADDVSTTVEARDLYEVHILASAEFYAEQAKQTKSPKDYDYAISLYKRFIEEYPYSSLVAQARFELAELLYFAGRFKDASIAYMEVLKNPDSRETLEEAAYGYLLSEAKKNSIKLQDDKGIKPMRDEGGMLLGPTAIGDLESGFLKAVSFYAKTIDHGIRRQIVLYRAAEIFYSHNQFDKARESLEIILKDKKGSSLATNALRLISTTYDLENNWQKVVETNRRLVNHSQSVDLDTIGDSSLQFGNPEIAAAWRVEKSGQLAQAAAQFEHFPVSFPRSSESPLALFKAAVLYRQLAQLTSSNRLLARLIKEYSQSSYVQRAELLMAANEQSLLRFETAADMFEAIGKKYGKESISSQAYLNASVLRTGMHQYAQAARDQEAYAQRTSIDEEWLRAAHLYQLAGDQRAALKIYKHFSGGAGGRDFVIRALFEKAQLTYYSTTIPVAKEQALSDCRAIQVIQKKYSHTLSARANHAAAGCIYLATWKSRDELLTNPRTETWEVISRLYSQVLATNDNEWISLALADAGAISEKLVSTNPDKFTPLGISYYKKSLELASDIYSSDIFVQAMRGLNRLSPGSIALVRPELFRINGFDENENRISSKLSLAQLQKAVSEDPQNARTYFLISRLFLDKKMPELAKLVLSEGLRNTDSDLGLQANLGYLLLHLHLMDEVQSLIDELKTQEIPSVGTRILMADAFLVQGKFNEATDTLNYDGGSPSEKSQLLLARFSNYLVQNDSKGASVLLSSIEKLSPYMSQACFALAIYYQVFQKDLNIANRFFAKAKEMGQWGQWFDRQPAASQTEKGTKP